MNKELFHFPNELLNQITVLRKITSTDRFPCFSCFDDKINKTTCKVCLGSGFIYGSHPMVQFSEDFIEKKIEYLRKQ